MLYEGFRGRPAAELVVSTSLPGLGRGGGWESPGGAFGEGGFSSERVDLRQRANDAGARGADRALLADGPMEALFPCPGGNTSFLWTSK